MYHVRLGTETDWPDAIQFLETRGLARNPWLVWMVHSALSRPWERKAILCRRRDGQVAGVAQFLRFADLTEPPRMPQDCDYEADLDAVDGGAASALLTALPAGLCGRFQILSPVVQAVLDRLPACRREEGALYYSVSAAELRPVGGEDVIELCTADSRLFEATERGAQGDPLAHLGNDGRRGFAVVREGRAATSASIAPVIHDWPGPRNVMAICGVFTEPRWRRRGLARCLVSHITERILADGHAPIYWTDADNLASHNLARGLGYEQFAQAVTYVCALPSVAHQRPHTATLPHSHTPRGPTPAAGGSGAGGASSVLR